VAEKTVLGSGSAAIRAADGLKFMRAAAALPCRGSLGQAVLVPPLGAVKACTQVGRRGIPKEKPRKTGELFSYVGLEKRVPEHHSTSWCSNAHRSFDQWPREGG
jgi:hypothetical protein